MRTRYWAVVLARFMSGQVLIVLLNLITGFLILRLLSVQEYGIYTLAATLQAVGSIGADMAVSQAVVSIGAAKKDDRSFLARLIASAIRVRAPFFAAALLAIGGLAYMGFPKIQVSTTGALWIVAAVGTAVALQLSASVRTSLLNVYHDSEGLTRAGLTAALARLVAVFTVCPAAPWALTALAINVLGLSLSSAVLDRYKRQYIGGAATPDAECTRQIRSFIVPLIPGVIYYLLQGQISVLLLAFAGASDALAEVGALGRLGQVIGLLSLLNGYFFQPYFAQIVDRAVFARRVRQVLVAVTAIMAVITLSVIFIPQVWLLILGPNYEGLHGEVVIAMITAQVSAMGALLYSVVIATRMTRGQWWQIVVGIGGQLMFVALVDVTTTSAALFLNLIPAVTYLIVQASLLAWILKRGTTS